jgi:hypothetical protein
MARFPTQAEDAARDGAARELVAAVLMAAKRKGYHAVPAANGEAAYVRPSPSAGRKVELLPDRESGVVLPGLATPPLRWQRDDPDRADGRFVVARDAPPVARPNAEGGFGFERTSPADDLPAEVVVLKFIEDDVWAIAT